MSEDTQELSVEQVRQTTIEWPGVHLICWPADGRWLWRVTTEGRKIEAGAPTLQEALADALQVATAHGIQ